MAQHAARFKKFGGERFEILGTDDVGRGYVRVRTRIVTSSESIQLDYLMSQRGGGWRIVDRRTVVTDPERGLRANEYVVELDGQRRLVHFWYRSHRRTGLLGPVDIAVDHFLGRFRDDRADGALVRLSTPVGVDDEIPARSRLAGFAVALEAELTEHWPREVPAS